MSDPHSILYYQFIIHNPLLCTSAGEAEEDGYDDEYQLEELEVSPADYIKPILVTNFRKSW